MSRSPYRLRGDPAECWRAVLFGEIVRALNAPTIVLAEESIRLPRSGRWESGLGRITPALDDALGATAFATAWRWSCAERGAHAWPGLPLIARHAVDAPVTVGPGPALAVAGEARVVERPAGRCWVLHGVARLGVEGPATTDWSEVDRIADIVSAWLDVPWAVEQPS